MPVCSDSTYKHPGAIMSILLSWITGGKPATETVSSTDTLLPEDATAYEELVGKLEALDNGSGYNRV
jgi:hypothetical protein